MTTFCAFRTNFRYITRHKHNSKLHSIYGDVKLSLRTNIQKCCRQQHLPCQHQHAQCMFRVRWTKSHRLFNVSHQIFSDSGGPLTVIGLNGLPVQVGIVSYGSSAGCEKGYVSQTLWFTIFLMFTSCIFIF